MHAKRRMGMATQTYPSFGKTPTKTLKSVFSWHVPYIYFNQNNIEATQDIYLLQKEFVTEKHNVLSFQIVGITLNGIIFFK